MFTSRDTSEPQEVFPLPDTESDSLRQKRATTAAIALFSPSAMDNFIAPEPLIISFKTSFTGSVTVYIYRDVTGFDPKM